MQQSNNPKHSTHYPHGDCALQTRICVDGITASSVTGVNVGSCFPVSALYTLLLTAATTPAAVAVPCITKLEPHGMYSLEPILQDNTEQLAAGKTSGSDSCLSFAGDLHCLRRSAAAYITELEAHVCVRYVGLQAAKVDLTLLHVACMFACTRSRSHGWLMQMYASIVAQRQRSRLGRLSDGICYRMMHACRALLSFR